MLLFIISYNIYLLINYIILNFISSLILNKVFINNINILIYYLKNIV